MRLFYTILYTAFFVCSLAQAKQVVLTDTQGRELVCTLLNKNESSVLVSNKSNRKFTIPLINLSQDSTRLISSHKYFIPELLKELKADDALVCEYRMSDRSNGFSHCYTNEIVGPSYNINDQYKKETANVDLLKLLIENHGKTNKKDFSTTELSLSIYGFIKATADNEHSEAVGRIIQGSFNSSPSPTWRDLSWRVNRVNELIQTHPNEDISEEISGFFEKVFTEKAEKRAKRLKTQNMSYRASRELVNLAKKLLWRIDSTEEIYSF